jgi:hypothetical protein
VRTRQKRISQSLKRLTYGEEKRRRRTNGILEVSDQVVTVLLLLKSGECHFRTRNVLFGVFQVVEHGLLGPGDALVDVGGRVRVPVGLSGLSAAVGGRRRRRRSEKVSIGPIKINATDSKDLKLDRRKPLTRLRGG